MTEADDMDTRGQITQNNNGSSEISNGNGHVKNPSDLAIFEQYRNQVWCFQLIFKHVWFYLV